jgi:hypothetical protein
MNRQILAIYTGFVWNLLLVLMQISWLNRDCSKVQGSRCITRGGSSNLR